MTGLEFKLYLLGILAMFLLAAPLAIIAGLLRASPVTTFECEHPTKGFPEEARIISLYTVAAYVYLVYINWDDKREVLWIFGYSIPLLLMVLIQVLIARLETALINSWVPPKDNRGICPEFYGFAFVAFALLWNDLGKGQNSALYRMFIG